MALLSSGSLDLLHVEYGLVFWTIVTFSLVMLVLWRFAWTPIVTALDARNTKVEDDLNKSEKLRNEAEDLLKDYESKLDNAKKEVADLLEEGRRDGEVSRATITEEAQAEAARIRERSSHDIEQAKLKAVKEIQDLAVEISLQLMSNVLQKDVNDAEHKKLIMQELERLKSDN
ncbi:MAG: F0F1 ATP synthase subunit B [Leptospirales bacterium]